jgi:hypothetical protein
MCNFHCVDKSGEIFLESDAKYIFESNNTITNAILENKNKITHYFEFDIYGVVAWNKLYDKKLFDEIRYPRGKIFEDAFTTHKLIDKANKVVASSEYKYYYLWRNDSLTKRCFTPVQLERLEASMDRYGYISGKYPNFEQICRKHIFTDLLYCAYKAYEDGVIFEYRQEIETAVKKAKEYNTDDCGLSKNEKLLIKLLFAEMEKYATAIKIYQTNRPYRSQS